MLILVGEEDEAAVRKTLLKYVGGFRTVKSAVARKKPLAVSGTSSRLPSGVTSYLKDGPDKGVYVDLETEFALTSAHVLTAPLAEEVLRRRLVQSLSGSGFSVALESHFSARPLETYACRITCTPVPGAASGDMLAALRAVRSALQEAATAPIPDADLRIWKDQVRSEVVAGLADPEKNVTNILYRYALGKDLYTHYAESLSAIDAAAIQDMLRSLATAGRTETIVQ